MELAAISQRVDEVALPIRAHDDGCEAALGDRRGDKSHLRTRVENAISPLLPHGRVLVEDVARSLGMSERTLARKLSDETLNFTEILQQLRRNYSRRVGWSRAGCHGRGLCQGVADGGESAPAVAAAGFDN
jgi:hypothetical protein